MKKQPVRDVIERLLKNNGDAIDRMTARTAFAQGIREGWKAHQRHLRRHAAPSRTNEEGK